MKRGAVDKLEPGTLVDLAFDREREGIAPGELVVDKVESSGGEYGNKATVKDSKGKIHGPYLLQLFKPYYGEE